MSSKISEHAIPHHLYADDSQLYVPLASGDSAAALSGWQTCLASIHSWMSTIKLKLNPDKTEFLLIENEWQQSKFLSLFPTELLVIQTYPAKSAGNHGVMFDINVTFHWYISAVCSSCFYHMWDLQHIHRHLDLDSATTLVSSRLDCCNALLYGIVDTDLSKLQCAQNQLAHVGTKSPPFTHSVPLLRSLSLVTCKI